MLFCQLQDCAVKLVWALMVRQVLWSVLRRLFIFFVIIFFSGVDLGFHQPDFVLSMVYRVRALWNNWFWDIFRVLILRRALFVEVCHFVHRGTLRVWDIMLPWVVVCFILAPSFRLLSQVPIICQIIIWLYDWFISGRASACVFEMGWVLLIKVNVVLKILGDTRSCHIWSLFALGATFWAESTWQLWLHSWYQSRLSPNFARRNSVFSNVWLTSVFRVGVIDLTTFTILST